MLGFDFVTTVAFLGIVALCIYSMIIAIAYVVTLIKVIAYGGVKDIPDPGYRHYFFPRHDVEVFYSNPDDIY